MNPKADKQSLVVMMDGTFASLAEGRESSVARLYATLAASEAVKNERIGLYYAPGQQWAAWRTLPELVSGSTLDHAIRAAYAWLSRNWQPGVALYFFGYSRGGVAVSALAEMIARVGLLRAEHASDDNVLCAWNMYRYCVDARVEAGRAHDHVPIRMVGLLDTVMSLGIRLPFLLSLSGPGFGYAEGHLPPNVENGAHALALDETRLTFEPILWDDASAGERVEQMWFRGCHPDIGGQLAGNERARPLANLPLVWLMSRAAELGLDLPDGWRDDYPCDRNAPSVGSWRSWGKAFLLRGARRAGEHASEALHSSVARPYGGPARLTGALAAQAAPRRARRVRPRRDGGMDGSATI